MGSIVDLLDGLHARLLTSASIVEAGEAKEQAAFVEADRTRQVALAEATKSEEHATADALAASSALPSTQEEAAAVAEAQNKTAERQRILEEVCEHAPASATEVAAELGEATSAYEAEKTRCDTEQDEVAAALAESEHDSKALAEMRTSLEKMENMREEEHASFVAEEKE